MRLATSCLLAARSIGLDDSQQEAICRKACRSYAKAHARSGDRRAIALDLGRPKAFATRITEVALQHAQWAEQDHAQLLEGIARGQISSGSLV